MLDPKEVEDLTRAVLDLVGGTDPNTAMSSLMGAILFLNNTVSTGPVDEKFRAAQLAETIIEGAQLYAEGAFDNDSVH